MTIRLATYEDIPALMEIFRNARGIMRASGNMTQWNDSYPSEEVARNDIRNGNSYVMCDEGRIIATMAFIQGPDPTYAMIYDGEWLNDNPYYVIHRIAVLEPGHDAAGRFFDWAFEYLSSRDSKSEFKVRTCIRIDTHKDNIIMQHVLDKHGFIRCGVILLADGAPRVAYQSCRKH